MSELYELPNGWEWNKLEKLTKLQNGFAFKSNLFVDSGLPIVRIKNIKNEKVLLDDVVYFKMENYGKKLDTYQIKRNDILIAMSGATTGKIGLYESDEIAYQNQRVGLFRIDNSDLRSYLFYFLSTQIEKNLEQSLGAAQPNLSTQQINDIEIPLPPLSEQQRIVSKLDLLFEKIDKAIALHQKNMDEADVFMGSVLNDVFDKEKVSKWKSYQFDKLSKFIDYRGKTPNKIDNGIELITAKNVRFGYLSDEPKEYMSENSYDEWMVRGIPNKGDVLFTTEAPLGNVAILNTDEKRIFAQRIITFQPLKDDIYTSNFLFYYMMSAYFRDELFEKSTGTTVKGIKSSILKKFIIQIPPLQIQQKVVKYLDEISEKIEKVKSIQKDKMDSLKALKASILDKAFRGEL